MKHAFLQLAFQIQQQIQPSQRTHLSLRIERIPDFQEFQLVDQPLLEPLINVFVDNEPLGTEADLAEVGNPAFYR